MKVATHNGTFHADEVVAIAIIEALYGPVHLIRTRNPQKFESCDLVIDVGSKYDGTKFFDHHQADFTLTYPNGNPYASAGLVWKHFGPSLITNTAPYGNIDEIVESVAAIIQSIDNIDTGTIRPTEDTYHFSQFISSFNHLDVNNDEMQIIKFRLAVEIVHSWLLSIITKAKQDSYDKAYVISQLQGSNEYLFLDRYVNWQPVVASYNQTATTPIRRVVFPSTDSWRVQAVTDKDYFPSNWRASTNFKEVSGLSSAIFCHKAGFIAGFAELSDAIVATCHFEQD